MPGEAKTQNIRVPKKPMEGPVIEAPSQKEKKKTSGWKIFLMPQNVTNLEIG